MEFSSLKRHSWGVHANTSADLLWSEPSRLISWVQRGTQPGLKQKTQAIYQAADADSLNSLAQKMLQTRPLLQKRDSTTGVMTGILVLLMSYPLLSFLIFLAFFLSFCLLNVWENEILWGLKLNFIWTILFLHWRSIMKLFDVLLYLYLCLRYSGPSYIWVQLRKQNIGPRQLWARATNMLHIYSLFFVSLPWWKENSGELSLNQTSFNGPAVCWPSRVGWNLILSNTLHCAGNQITRGPTIHSTRVQFQRYNAIKAQ